MRGGAIPFPSFCARTHDRVSCAKRHDTAFFKATPSGPLFASRMAATAAGSMAKKWLTTSSVLLSAVSKSSPHRLQYRTTTSVREPHSASRHNATWNDVLAVRAFLRACPFFGAFNPRKSRHTGYGHEYPLECKLIIIGHYNGQCTCQQGRPFGMQ